MKKILLFLCVVAFACVSCNQSSSWKIKKFELSAKTIDASLDSIQDTAYLQLLQPQKDALDAKMSVVIGSIPADLTLDADNPTLLYWAADAMCTMARKVTKANPDFAVVNAGGIRCSQWSAGDITLGHVFRLMPFENKLAIITMKGTDVQALLEHCKDINQRGISKEAKTLVIDPEKDYHIATNSYLTDGSDDIFNPAVFVSLEITDFNLRDLYIDYFKK